MVAGDTQSLKERRQISRQKNHLRTMRYCLLWNFAKVILFWTLA